jgi:hypothetical protein
MRGKYITLQIRLACSKKPDVNRKPQRELERIVLERRKIMQQFIDHATSYKPHQKHRPELSF